MNKDANQYFDEKYYEVLENKTMIHVFKRTFWYHHLKWWKGFAKDCYVWEEDKKAKMNIIKEVLKLKKK